MDIIICVCVFSITERIGWKVAECFKLMCVVRLNLFAKIRYWYCGLRMNVDFLRSYMTSDSFSVKKSRMKKNIWKSPDSEKKQQKNIKNQ